MPTSPKFIEAVKNTIEDSFKTLIQQISEKIDEKLEKFEHRVYSLELKTDELRCQLSATSKELNSTKMENDCLKQQVKEALKKSNENEQYSRLEAIRIYGIPENRNENCRDIVCDIIQKELGLDIQPKDINKIHRLERRNRDTNKPRPIILRFFSHGHKRACIENRKKLKHSGIVIVEDLTHTNHLTLNRAQNNECVENTWSTEGKLYVKLKDGTRLRIFAYDNINEQIDRALRRRPSNAHVNPNNRIEHHHNGPNDAISAAPRSEVSADSPRSNAATSISGNSELTNMVQ